MTSPAPEQMREPFSLPISKRIPLAGGGFLDLGGRPPAPHMTVDVSARWPTPLGPTQLLRMLSDMQLLRSAVLSAKGPDFTSDGPWAGLEVPREATQLYISADVGTIVWNARPGGTASLFIVTDAPDAPTLVANLLAATGTAGAKAQAEAMRNFYATDAVNCWHPRYVRLPALRQASGGPVDRAAQRLREQAAAGAQRGRGRVSKT